jgi:hypothetical protein
MKTEMADLNVADGGDNQSDGFLVKWNSQNDQWIPTCSPCQQSIPTYPSDDARKWAQRRMDLTDVERTLDSNGFMQGLPCVPEPTNTCPGCGVSTEDSARLEQSPFILRTYRGAVLRRVFSYQCLQCHHVRRWDPYSECILTINKGREGG